MRPKILKAACFIIAGALVASIIIIVYSSKQIVSPPRRSIQEYHQSWLNSPETHGIQIESNFYLNGSAPCLLVSPRKNEQPSERGGIIRHQLTKMGYTLEKHGNIRGTLVLLHGRKGRKEDLLPVAERFCAVGFRCLLPDLPGHGESSNQKVYYATKAHEEDYVNRLLQEAITRHNLSPDPIGIWGISMGGAFAIRNVISNPQQWKCAVIVSSFDSLDEVIQKQFHSRAWIFGEALFRGVDFTLRKNHDFDLSITKPVAWIANTNIPTMIAHGTSDSLIPLEKGQNLYNAIPHQEKRWIEVDGGNHDNVLVTEMPLYATMASWFFDYMFKDSAN